MILTARGRASGPLCALVNPWCSLPHAVARAMAQQGMQRRAQQWLNHHNPDEWFLVPAVGRMVESDREGHPLDQAGRVRSTERNGDDTRLKLEASR